MNHTTKQLGATLKAAMFALAGAATAATASAAVTFSHGDLIVAFVAADNTTGSSQNVTFNLGSAASFRDNPNPAGALADLGTVLSATYGNNWFERADLSWGIVAAANKASPSLTTVTNGDTNSAIYVSRDIALDAPNSNGTFFVASQVQGGAAAIFDFVNQNVNGKAAWDDGGINRTVLADSTQANSFTNKTKDYFDFTIIDGGVTGKFGTGDEFAYLDLFRVLSRTSGTGLVNPTDNLGEAQYITTFSIDANGVITAAVSAVPEPSAFAALAGAAALGFVASRRRRA